MDCAEFWDFAAMSQVLFTERHSCYCKKAVREDRKFSRLLKSPAVRYVAEAKLADFGMAYYHTTLTIPALERHGNSILECSYEFSNSEYGSFFLPRNKKMKT